MWQIKTAVRAQFDEIAKLIIKYNQDPASRCLHSHDEQDVALLATMERWAEEESITFAVAVDERDQIIALFGAEFDEALKEAWLWGPFVPKGKDDLVVWHQLADQLFTYLLEIVPFEPRRLHAFLNEPFADGAEAYERWGFVHEKNAYIFVAERPKAVVERRGVGSAVGWLEEKDHQSFAPLFDTTFPDTFITGAGIIAQLNEQKKVAVYIKEGALLGFCYGIVADGGEEGYIEFLGTDLRARRTGVAQMLLHFVMDWLFYDLNMVQIGLTTSDNNLGAQALYKRVGFEIKYTGLVYRFYENKE